MAFCPRCGAQNKDEARFCNHCGFSFTVNSQANKQNQSYDPSEKFKKLNNTADTTKNYEKKDIDDNKSAALVSYIFCLFVIPLLVAKNSKFAHFHANQGLILFICEVGASLAFKLITSIFITILPLLSFALGILSGIISIIFLVLSVMGIINAANGVAKELPIIGKFKIIK